MAVLLSATFIPGVEESVNRLWVFEEGADSLSDKSSLLGQLGFVLVKGHFDH